MDTLRVSEVPTRENGFTLVEILVVITIIAVVGTSLALYGITNLESKGARSAKLKFEAAFTRAQQEARTTRIPHYLVFCNNTEQGNGEMMIVREAVHDDCDGFSFKPSTRKSKDGCNDSLVEDGEFSLSEDMYFVMDESPVLDPSSEQHWIKFGADSSIVDSSGLTNKKENPAQVDRTWRYAESPTVNKVWGGSDLQIVQLLNLPDGVEKEQCPGTIEKQKGHLEGRMEDFVVVDWEAVTGKISRTYYADELQSSSSSSGE